MENLVSFRANQQVLSTDLQNIENYTQQTFSDLITDTIDPSVKYAGLGVTASGTTGISVATGRYYASGQMYSNPNAVSFSVQSQLPVTTQKIATLVAWGAMVQTNVQPRSYIVNADTGAFQPQTVSMENSY